MRFTFNAATAAICVLCLAAIAFGAPPEIVELSPVPKVELKPQPAPPSDTLTIGKYRWFGVAGYDGPITWEIEGTAAGAEETAETSVVLIGTVEGQDKVTRNTVPAKALIVWGVDPGTVTVRAMGVVDGKAKTVAKKTLVVGNQGPRPPPVDPPVNPPVDPPVTPPTKGLYFMLIRADGPTAPDFEKTMRLSAWDEIRKAGHTVKDFTLSDANRLGANLPAGTTLPCVLPLAVSPDGKESKIIPPPLAFPRDDAGIRKLLEVKP
jgi:hypothetical protein